MPSTETPSPREPAPRFVPRRRSARAVGVLAAAAVSAFSWLVFGPLADQRVRELAGFAAMEAGADAPAAVALGADARVRRE